MNTHTLVHRCQRIGLTKAELARRAGLDHTTVARALRNPARSIAGNVDRLNAVIENAERDLLGHLVALHGAPAVPATYARLPHHPASVVAGGVS